MKKIKNTILLGLIGAFVGSCEIGEQIDPNSPDINGGILENANVAQLNNLVAGTLFQMRDQVNVYHDEIGVIGREMYRFSGSDPRWHSDLLTATDLDNNAFYTTRPFTARYRTVKNANILIEAVTNTPESVVSATDKEGYLGFAKTIIAHELLIVANLQGSNGIRTEVSDPDNLGPFVSEAESLTFIAGLLDEAEVHLDALINSVAPGDDPAEFILPLSFGFAGFDTPGGFKQFNRALAARIAAYRGNFSDVLNFLDETFIDVAAIDPSRFDEGFNMVFSTGGGDLLNPLFLPLDGTGENRLAHPSFIADAEAGDTRVNKAVARTPDDPATEDEVEGPGPVTVSNLTSNFDVFIYSSNTSPVAIINYEELVFLYAEANINGATNLQAAVDALNIVRNNYGLADYSGAMTEAALLDEMLDQKRYSLWNEGHRWLDLRRYGKLGELPLDRAGDFVWDEFPRPFQEIGVAGG